MKYKVLNKQFFIKDKYSIKPIEIEKRYDIMKWRNEQMYHLRQNSIIEKKDQDKYFTSIISKLFNKKNPNQILFSFYFEEEFIGYGGLVHIDWHSLNAEISFLMNTKYEKDYFDKNWNNFLKLIEEVAFKDLSFKKIYVFAYDLRPKLFQILCENNYNKEAILKSHYLYNSIYYDAKIYSKIMQ